MRPFVSSPSRTCDTISPFGWHIDSTPQNYDNARMICRNSVLFLSKNSPSGLSFHSPRRSAEISRFASTRYSRPQDAVDESKLPRFIRRQQLQEGSSRKPTQQISNKTKAQSPSLSPRVTPTYRSRHYDPSNEAPKAGLRRLEPHALSGRLKRLCDSNNVDDAVYMLKNAPLDSQNTQVWNTLIWETLKAKRFQLSYQLFVDVSIS